LDSAGNCGIGVTPSAWSGITPIQISRGSFAADTGSYILSQNVYNNGSNRYIATAAAMQFQAIPGTGFLWNIAPSGTAGNAITFTQAMTLDASGNLGVIGNFGPASAKGIDFSATANGPNLTSELLNDYEEGTFTPTVTGTTTAGTGTYSNQTGYYTKVGRLVTITVYMNWTAHTGTGNMRFSNLPFTSANVATNYNGISIAFLGGIALTAGNVFYGNLEFGSAFITAIQYPTGGGPYSLVPIDTSAEIAFSATYFV
jgi:hypothetical protein